MESRKQAIWLRVWGVATVTAILMRAYAFTPITPTRASAYTVAKAPEEVGAAHQETLLQEIAGMLGRRRYARNYTHLAAWPLEQLTNLHTWLSLGIQIEGVWKSEELNEIVSLLNAFGHAYGEARFIEILETAVTQRSDGSQQHLRVIRKPGQTPPAAAWYARSGRIVLTDGLWDTDYIREHYSWSFLSGDYANPSPDITTRQVVIGHEFGHVIIDGLRVEAAAAGYSALSIEALYASAIPTPQWPHFTAATNEHVATEIAVWALGIARTTEVEAFRASVLIPTAAGTQWPVTVAHTYPPAQVGR